MKPATTLLHRLLLGGLCLASFCCRAGDVSDNSQVITPLVQRARLKSQEKNLDWLTNWPSEGEIRETEPKTRKSNAVPMTPQSDGKPDITVIATSPETALREAEYWIATVLQPKWVCSNLVEHLMPMQADDAKNSTVVCRYEVKGNTIQVIQKAAVMCIVVRPDPDMLKSVAGSAGKGRIVFEQFFRKGDVMASYAAKEITESEDKTRIFVLDESKQPIHAVPYWWEWKAWYTDGWSVAVLLNKRSDERQHIPNPDDLWF